MISLGRSKRGDKIIRWNGKLLCSGVDPHGEAKKWIEKNRDRFKYSVIVCGAGSGFHIQALAKSYPDLKILVIEQNSIILNYVSAKLNDLENVTFVLGSHLSELSCQPKLREMVKRRYSVISFFPACALEQEFYIEVLDFLLGRNEKGFRWLCNVRGEFKRYISNDKNEKPLLRALPSHGALSLADIKKWTASNLNNEIDEHSLMILALGELIA